jgi:hypothetical protein
LHVKRADPITLIVAALAAGAAAAAKDVSVEAVKDAYHGLKALIVDKFGDKGDVTAALDQAEKRPDSEARRAVLKEELAHAGADKDTELLAQAQAFLDLLKQHGMAPSTTYAATVIGSGAAAQGPDAAAAGERGVVVKGDAHGGVRTGDDR